jgi:uncharacterized protein (DUF983 family)
MTVNPAGHALRLSTMLRRRCPRCGTGQIFSAPLSMIAECPVCHLKYERGPGYFTGAMYVSYALAIPLIALLTLVESLFLPRWTLFRLVLLATAICTPLIPWVWQYSRAIWIHFDQWMDPEL